MRITASSLAEKKNAILSEIDAAESLVTLAKEITTVYGYLESIAPEDRERISVLAINKDSTLASWGITGLFGYNIVYVEAPEDDGVDDETWIKWEEELKEN